MKKIMFFDIDGTLTKETDGSIPKSAIEAIQTARKYGNLMYINTGRCFQNVEERFREIGFDGYVCGCGTNIYSHDRELFYQPQSHERTMEILNAARSANADILFESKYEICFDTTRPLRHPDAIKLCREFIYDRNYEMRKEPESEDFFCDKFVVWFENESDISEFRKVSDLYFECIDRSSHFKEFVPLGFSKASGIRYLLDYHRIAPQNAYAIGDSNNDLSMLRAVPNSIAMGNSYPETLFSEVSYVTRRASEDGIYHALRHFGFI